MDILLLLEVSHKMTSLGTLGYLLPFLWLLVLGQVTEDFLPAISIEGIDIHTIPRFIIAAL